MQRPDALVVRDGQYDILGYDGPQLFEPERFGITPVALSTACRRGFFCRFEITSDKLFLPFLKIRAKGGLYPLIHDTPPSIPGG